MLTISKPRVATFPEFTSLSPDLYEFYQGYLFDYPQHCDFSLNNLLIWFGGDKIKLSMLNRNLVLQISESIYANELGGTSWYTIIGRHKSDKTLSTFFESGVSDSLMMVPDYFVSSIKRPDKWQVDEDKANRDYILSIPSLLSKQGKLYENFRYQISYFLRYHSEDARLQDLDLMSPNVQKEITASLKNWKVNSFAAGANDEKRVDEVAIHRLMELQPHLLVKHRCIGLYIDDELAGITIFHVPNSRFRIGLGNHIKFNGKYKRMFDFLVFATASRLNTEGIKFLNAEQDMGLHGIRHHKKDLNPITFFQKYTIRPKQD